MDVTTAAQSAGDTPGEPTAGVLDDVIGILAEMLERDPATITAESRLFDDLAFDSTGVLELLMHLEDHFGVEFDPFMIEPRDFETIGSVTEFVGKQLES